MYEEKAVPDMIKDITVKEISKVDISINYTDGSVQSTIVEEGNDLSITYLFNGTLVKAFACRLKRILHTQPNMSFEVDASTEMDGNKVIIPIVTIREIHNLSYPDNDKLVQAPTTNTAV